MKKSQKNIRYPRYALFWKQNNGEVHRYYSRRKKSVTLAADGLTEIKTAHFAVMYGGGDLRNDSIVYKMPEQRATFLKDLRMFTSKEEVDSMMKFAQESK